MRLRDALGIACGTRGVENHGDIGWPAFFDLVGEEFALGELAAGFLKAIQAHQLWMRVMAQPARIVETDALQPRALRQSSQPLLSLLPLLHDPAPLTPVLHPHP